MPETIFREKRKKFVVMSHHIPDSDAFCGLGKYGLIITDSGEAESESIPLKIRYDQIFFMIPHRGTEITEKNRASVFSAALCGISDCGPPLNPL